jgi:hypothetical protein
VTVSHAEAWEEVKRAAKLGLSFADIAALLRKWVSLLPPEQRGLRFGVFGLGLTPVEEIPVRFERDPEFREAFLAFLRGL